MTLTLDIADDFADVVDNHEAVTVRPAVEENANAELLTNGSFGEDLTGWTLSGTTWEERLALCDVGGVYIGQSVATVAAATYLVSLDVFATWASTAPAFRVGTAIDGAQIETNTVSQSGRMVFAFTASGATTFLTLHNGDGCVRLGNVSIRLLGDTSVTKALRRAVSNREAAASAGKYRTGDVKWHIAQSELTSPPALGGIVIDGDGTEWTILAVDQQTLNNRWRLWCRRLTLATEPLGTCTIQKAYLDHSDGGAERATWRDWAHQVPCRIQQQATGQATFADRRVTPGRFTIYTPTRLPVDHRFRVTADGCRYYKIQGYANPDVIDGMFAIEAEANPWALN